MRYKLRTLLILLAILPPLLWIGWTKYEAWRAEQERQVARERLMLELRKSQNLTGIRIRRWQLDTGSLLLVPTNPPRPIQVAETILAADPAGVPAQPTDAR